MIMDVNDQFSLSAKAAADAANAKVQEWESIDGAVSAGAAAVTPRTEVGGHGEASSSLAAQ